MVRSGTSVSRRRPLFIPGTLNKQVGGKARPGAESVSSRTTAGCEFGYVTLIECVLETGRTHQIRAHLRYIKHPLFNDATYGGDQILKGTIYTKYKQYIQNCFDIIPRHALHAKTLGFVHPTTKKMMSFDSELPADFAEVLGKWRTYSQFNAMEETL